MTGVIDLVLHLESVSDVLMVSLKRLVMAVHLRNTERLVMTVELLKSVMVQRGMLHHFVMLLESMAFLMLVIEQRLD